MELTNYQRLKFLRKQAGFTQAYMAKALGIKGSSYSLIESGKTKLSDYHLQVIKDILKLDVNYIVNGSSEIPADIKTSNMIHMKEGDTINRRLEELREERGIPLKKVADDLDIPVNTLYRYESDMEPGIDKIKKFADYYGVSVKYILHGIKDSKETEVTHWKEMMEGKMEQLYEQVRIIKDIILKMQSGGNFIAGNRMTDNEYPLYFDKKAA